jgi:hypothetical protein
MCLDGGHNGYGDGEPPSRVFLPGARTCALWFEARQRHPEGTRTMFRLILKFSLR